VAAESHQAPWPPPHPIDSFQEPRRQDTNRTQAPLLILGFLLIFSVFSGVTMWTGNASESSLGRDLQSHGAQTAGTVTATQPSNHEFFSYRYMVDGAEYSGNSDPFPSAQKLMADQLHFGQRIPIIYDSKEPTLSCSCDVDQLAGSQFYGTLPFLIATPVLIVLMIALLVRGRRQPKSSEQIGPTVLELAIRAGHPYGAGGGQE
jgi:hypothetical protein